MDRELGDALGQKYVEETFGAEGKQRMQTMVKAIEAEMDKNLHDLDWMTPETKKQAVLKLDAIANKIGYPDRWRDYSSVRIDRDDLFGDTLAATSFEVQRQLREIGKPVDRMEFKVTPPTVDACYSAAENNINFPAGILQPPFYSTRSDDAVNYGGVGWRVGHELTHGFDDQGRKYDGDGNLRDWWTKEDAAEFIKRAQCLIDEYSAFETVPGVPLSGKLTLGENTADNGGMRLAFMAMMDFVAGKAARLLDGYTPQQRFFLGAAQAGVRTRRRKGRSALARPVSRGRHTRKHGGVSEGLFVRGRPTDGGESRLPGVVERRLPHLREVLQTHTMLRCD